MQGNIYNRGKTGNVNAKCMTVLTIPEACVSTDKRQRSCFYHRDATVDAVGRDLRIWSLYFSYFSGFEFFCEFVNIFVKHNSVISGFKDKKLKSYFGTLESGICAAATTMTVYLRRF